MKTSVLKVALVERNNRLLDRWSAVHFASGLLLGWALPPIIALILLIGWEPLETLVLSPLLLNYGIVFGYEGWRNSLSDIVFDLVGFGIGYFGLVTIVGTLPHLFGL